MPVVLVVEDETLIRELVAEELEVAGYTVVIANDADQAIAILEARQDIHLVFTDINMPGAMDGLKLAAAVRDRWPPVHIIITSGKIRPLEIPGERAFYSQALCRRECCRGDENVRKYELEARGERVFASERLESLLAQLNGRIAVSLNEPKRTTIQLDVPLNGD